MKRFLMTIALTCVLSASALAGDMPTCGVTSTQPGGATQITDETLPGNIPTDGAVEPTMANATLEAMISLLSFLV